MLEEGSRRRERPMVLKKEISVGLVHSENHVYGQWVMQRHINEGLLSTRYKILKTSNKALEVMPSNVRSAQR